MKNTKHFLWCYLIILFTELIVVSDPDWHLYRIVTKPLVVGSLLLFFLLQQTKKKTKILVTAALCFTLLGDAALIYDSIEYLFIGGLVAFLIANIIYIVQFSRNRDKDINYIYPSLILLLYAFSLFWYLHDSLQNLTIPVAIYMVSAWLMILFAYLRKDSLTDNGYIFVLTSTLFMMLTASIVAITRFKSAIPFAPVFIMMSHGIAQLCMVMGILMSDPVYKLSRNQNSIN